jgi:hypothetical protein
MAFSFSTSIHQKWPYVGYWFSRALSAVGRHAQALTQIEAEISVRPGDEYLLDQKAVVLAQLRTLGLGYEDKAFEFFKFRAEALPNDFFGLAEIIGILQGRGNTTDAWPLIDRNLPSKAFPVSRLALACGVSMSDLKTGFRHSKLYAKFRSKFSVEDHCVTLHSRGLSPTIELIAPLEYILMAPFGIAADQLGVEAVTFEELNFAAMGVLRSIVRIFPHIGSGWLAETRPKDSAERKRLLVIGMSYLTDVVIAETARQVAFLKGAFRIPGDEIFPTEKPDWSEIAADASIRLLQHVVADWGLVPDGETNPHTDNSQNEPG